MKIKLNPDQEIVNTIREGLKRTGGYCPCRRERTEATKCMCQEFKPLYALLQILAGLREERYAVKETGCHLQAEKQRIIKDNRKESFSWLN